jgi:hypothetical protein
LEDEKACDGSCCYSVPFESSAYEKKRTGKMEALWSPGEFEIKSLVIG